MYSLNYTHAKSPHLLACC